MNTTTTASVSIKHPEQDRQSNKENTALYSANYSNDRRREEMGLHFHMKNQKKYTHLYQLEKYFK